MRATLKDSETSSWTSWRSCGKHGVVHVYYNEISSLFIEVLFYVVSSSILGLTGLLGNWQTEWLTDGWRGKDNPINWLTQCLPTHWLAEKKKDRLTDRPTNQLTDWLADWLTDWLTDWPTDQLTDRLTDWLIDWLTDWLAGWLTDWLSD